MDSKKLNMIMTALKVGLVALGVLAFFMILLNVPQADAVKADIDAFRDGGAMGFATSYTGFILFLGLGLILLFFVVQLITNTKKTVKSIIGLVAALVVFLILYAMGTTDTNETLQLAEAQHVDSGTIASTTAGLITVLLGVGLGLLVWILGPLMGRFRK